MLPEFDESSNHLKTIFGVAVHITNCVATLHKNSMHHKKKRNLRLDSAHQRSRPRRQGSSWERLAPHCCTKVDHLPNACCRLGKLPTLACAPEIFLCTFGSKRVFSSGYKKLRGRPPRHAFVHQNPIGPALSRRGHRPCAFCDKRSLALLAGDTECKTPTHVN